MVMLFIFVFILFVGSVQPIMFMFGLMMVVLFYSFCVYLGMGSYWFSYGLVMVILSGVMVVFMYFLSFIPNEKFELYSMNLMMVFVVFMIVGVDVVMMWDESFVSINLWDFWYSMVNVFLVIVLLVMMVIVVWLSNVNEGAIRV
uniref:NADH dehydrogenase subunit 6 n=1 Tax=Goeldia sp. DPP-2018 TaxID=2136113 RepID=A0A2U8XCM2_9ARAC|nr:NADH dehydrogenase subunit 6 [Goeldia sp. DPP-2018]